MTSRSAEHAGSWYTDKENKLDEELSSYLDAVVPSSEFAPPIQKCKAIIAPHAGYSYSGPAAAWAYKSINTTGIKRVFILGPSHHLPLDGCALSMCTEYQTPIGNLQLDLETIQELRNTRLFNDLQLDDDEAEHSIEMHLPYVRKIFNKQDAQDIKIIPIVVGSIQKEKEEKFGAVLAPYLAKDDTLFVISSDFCHWGTRFQYTYYTPGDGQAAIRLSRSHHPPSTGYPIHESISALDHEAMEILTMPPNTGVSAHHYFAEYLARTKNTICGRHPIGVLLGALAVLGKTGTTATLQWVRYEQSSQCVTIHDSSVSYASAYVTL
ncbi:hypothetical protein EIP91_008868 [Steccherinum ochraceum]|uniref:Uncharacterized protein n=1 Tax=Steccherinum ochraceum TaxID=92696 RepID=A0A4R0S236_9APHY|nr:hypothetical protein EIP91_008868 [Steccherinum ochraceum]